jgi:hypothetical protein
MPFNEITRILFCTSVPSKTFLTQLRLKVIFDQKRACENCWCMSFRLPIKEFDAGRQNLGNKQAI